MAGFRLSWLARNGRSPGEESLKPAIAAQAIEAEPTFGQLKPSEAARVAVQQPSLRRRRGGYLPHKRPAWWGVEKETPAGRRAGGAGVQTQQERIETGRAAARQ